ncbi:MAG: ABC transporter permease [bacterium]
MAGTTSKAGFLAGIFHPELVRFSFRALRQNRKFLFALLASLVPLVIGIVMFANEASTQNKPGSVFLPQYTGVVGGLILTGTVPFVALLLAGGMLADEVEDRTLTYLLVRPIPRRVLYASKALPVILTAAALGAVQALLFGLCRLAAALTWGMHTQIPYKLAVPVPDPPTIGAPLLVLQVIPVAMVAAALVAALFAALFGLVSLLTTRFHFLANLIIFLAWEVPFGHLGGASSYLTITYWGLSIAGSLDPTIGGMTSADANVFVAVGWMLLWTGIWVWVGMKRIPKRNFNITSAAT